MKRFYLYGLLADFMLNEIREISLSNYTFS